MRTLGVMTALLVVLGLCLPSYGEILVYKASQAGTSYDEVSAGVWEVTKDRSTTYVVLDVNATTGALTQSELIEYGRDSEGKFVETETPSLELVQATQANNKVTWIIEATQGEPNEGSIVTLIGVARNTRISSTLTAEIPSKLSGVGVEDMTNAGLRSIELSTVSAKLASSWTVKANGAGQDFDSTVDFIVTYFTTRGYTNRSDM